MGMIREYLMLVRPYGILFLGFMPVFGAIGNGTYDPLSLAVLLLIGILSHIFAFVQNDYYDVEIDQQSKYVVQRPLAKSVIPRTHAFVLFLGSFLIAVILAAFFSLSLGSIVVMVAAFLLFTIYNKFSKRMFGLECVAAAGVFLLGLFGGLSVSETISPLVVVISSVGFFQWMFSVGISANLKDVEYDTKLGIQTTPVRLGVHIAYNQLKKPRAFIVYSYSIKITHLMVAFIPFILGHTSMSIYGLPIPLLSFLIVTFGMLLTTHRLLLMPLRKRDAMLRYEGVHEGLSFLLFPIILMSRLVEASGLLPTILLFVLFIGWPLLSLRILFGKTFIPLE